MWPRLISRGKMSVGCREPPNDPASMWPRLISRGKNLPRSKPPASWSASMWPRLISRGKVIRVLGRGEKRNRFNVAAADQPRKVKATSEPLLIGFPGFNVAAADQPRKVACPIAGRRDSAVLQCGRG